MRSPLRQSDAKAAVLLCLTAGGLLFVPASISNSVRAVTLDATLPGQRAVNWIRDCGESAWQDFRSTAEHEQRIDALHGEVEQWKRRCRNLEIEAADARREVERSEKMGSAAIVGEPGRPLVVPQMLEASVLGGEFISTWNAGLFLDRGRTHGVAETSLVLDSPALKIDQGQDGALESGQPVYAGRSVVGRVVRVGRWMSTVRCITDPDYRGFAQLVRRTSQGVQFAAQGEIEGRGEEQHCRLNRIPSTETVRVGDQVYTAGRDNMLPFPMYYGKVVKVEHREGEPHWDIEVEPALWSADLDKVQVLRQRLNTDRVLAN